MLGYWHNWGHDEGGQEESEAIYGGTDYWVIAESRCEAVPRLLDTKANPNL